MDERVGKMWWAYFIVLWVGESLPILPLQQGIIFPNAKFQHSWVSPACQREGKGAQMLLPWMVLPRHTGGWPHLPSRKHVWRTPSCNQLVAVLSSIPFPPCYPLQGCGCVLVEEDRGHFGGPEQKQLQQRLQSSPKRLHGSLPTGAGQKGSHEEPQW